MRLRRGLDGGIGRQGGGGRLHRGAPHALEHAAVRNVPGQWAIRPRWVVTRALTIWLRRGRLRRQRDLAYELITAITGVTCVKHKGGPLMFPRLDPEVYPIEDDREFLLELLQENARDAGAGHRLNWPQPATSASSSCRTRGRSARSDRAHRALPRAVPAAAWELTLTRSAALRSDRRAWRAAPRMYEARRKR